MCLLPRLAVILCIIIIIIIIIIIYEASIRGEDSSVLRSSTLLRCVRCVMLLLLPNILKDVKASQHLRC